MYSESTQHLLRKLNQVFKDGYRPARGNESYRVMLNNGVQAYTMVNCLGHIFNLRNQQFNDYQFTPYRMYGAFDGITHNSNKKATQRLFDFIQATGLKIEECDPNKAITDFKSWKVALYFEDSKASKDFHFMLEETPQHWSSKIGFGPCIDQIQGTTPPREYYNQVIICPGKYEFYGTYKITNPNASESNRYVQDRTL